MAKNIDEFDDQLPTFHRTIRDNKLLMVDNYLEAVGVMTALKAGVTISSVRRPLTDTKVICEKVEQNDKDVKSSNEPVITEK